MGNYASEREPNAVQKGGLVVKRFYELASLQREPRVTAREVIEMLGCSKSSAYRILEGLSELLRLYKDGEDYVMLR